MQNTFLAAPAARPRLGDWKEYNYFIVKGFINTPRWAGTSINNHLNANSCMGAIKDKLREIGLSETDAEALADCVVTKKSCSWVNTDEVDNAMLERLGAYLNESGHRLRVSVESVPTRGKYIWEVKALKE